MKIDASNLKDHEYLRELIKRTGLTQAEVAKRIGVDLRTIQRWVAEPSLPTSRKHTYPVQYIIECLADAEHASDLDDDCPKQKKADRHNR
jgi:transcriptional regulator with XRE-family HTH domain